MSDSLPKLEKFNKLKKMLASPKGKATAEKDASKDPLKYLKNHQNMSIKGNKGIAF